MYKKITVFIREYYIYIIEFLFFFYIFYMTPQVCDRWMEENIHSAIEYPERFFISQIRWMQIANARVFSNIFSFFIDYNIVVHSLFDAAMMVYISYSGIKLANKSNYIARLLSVVLPIMLSFEIWREVYYYAATLYLSSACIALYWIGYIVRDDWITKNHKQKLKVVLALFISSVWIENLSVGLTGLFGILFIVLSIKNKKVNCEYLIYSLCTLCGFVIMIGDAVLAKSGRLAGIKQNQIQLDLDRISTVTSNNCFMYFVLSVLFVIIFSKRKGIICKLQFVGWILATIGMLAECLIQLYRIASTDPIDAAYCNLVVGWSKFENSYIDKVISYIQIYWNKLCLIMIVCMISSCIFEIIMYERDRRAEIALILLVIFAQSSTVFMNFGERIDSLYLFLIIDLLVIFVGQKDMNDKSWYIEFTSWILFLIMTVQMFSQLVFVDQQNRVAKSREKIANEVMLMQAENRWDYDDYLFMPKYTDDLLGRGLMGKNRKNPSADDVYYDVLIKYYGLNKDTKILFRGSSY